MNTKTGRELQPGDQVRLEDGRIVTLTRIGKGMFHGSRLLEWDKHDEWAHLFTGETVEVLN